MTMYKIPENLMSITEAARTLFVSKRTVYNAVKGGELRARYGGLRGTRIIGVYRADVAKLRK